MTSLISYVVLWMSSTFLKVPRSGECRACRMAALSNPAVPGALGLDSASTSHDCGRKQVCVHLNLPENVRGFATGVYHPIARKPVRKNSRNRARYTVCSTGDKKSVQDGGEFPNSSGQKRSKWLGGAAALAGMAVIGMSKFQPNLLFGSSGNSGNGGGLNGGTGGNGGNGGGRGNNGSNGNGRLYGAGVVADEEDAEKRKSPSKRTSGLVLASLSSSGADSLSQELRDMSLKRAYDEDDVAAEDGEDAVQRFKGKARFNFETNKFNVEVKRDNLDGIELTGEGDNVVTHISDGQAESEHSRKKLEVVGKQSEGKSGNVKAFQQNSGAAEGTISSTNQYEPAKKDDSGTDVLDWLSGLIDSALCKIAPKMRRKMEEKDRKEVAGEVASEVLRQMAGHDTFAKRSETAALKRLQQEAFADIMRLREKLDKLEATPDLKKLGGGFERTRIRARVAAGGAFVLMQDLTSYSSRASLEQAGLPAGLDIDFTFQTRFRDADVLTTKCVAGEWNSDNSIPGGAVRLGKLSYTAQVTNTIKAAFIPLGAEAKDVTEIVNPLQDEALTKFTSAGAALFDQCRGMAIGATYGTLSTLLSVSGYLAGWGDTNGPLCLSTLAQFIHQPTEHLIFSVSALNRSWPSPPLPSTPGIHWSEMKPFILSKSTRSASSTTDTLRSSDSSSISRMLSSGENWPSSAQPYEAKGTTMQSVAFSGEMDLGGFASLGGWLQVERGDWLQGDEKKRLQWSLSIARSTSELVNWGVSIGSSKPDYWSSLKEEELDGTGKSSDLSHGQLQLEAFCTCDCGRGFTLKPGLLYILGKQCQTPAVVIKSEWKF